MSVAKTKAEKARLEREGVLAAHVRGKPRAGFDPNTLARSYNLSVQRVTEILARNGG